jgi:hypothetical protein
MQELQKVCVADLPGDPMQIYKAMLARRPLLDAQLIDYIRATWVGTTKVLERIDLLGDWYLDAQAGSWLQLCIVRIFYSDAAGVHHSILREYAISVQGSLPRRAYIDG